METLDFLILGPFQVMGPQPLALGGPRQRAVLALLLLNRREVVTTDRLIDELWGENPPATVGKAIHVYVSNLRKVVGDGILLTSDGGYKLEVDPSQVDADRFDGLVARGRTALERGYPVMARERLREALGLWRGRPLADFSYHQFAQVEIARLAEARIAALEDRIEAELALGAHKALVPELETHVRAHPARERLWAQLMVALYRCGRQADALERYRRARRILIDEFAIEPGRDLEDVERAILTQDPALDAPALDPSMRLERALARSRPRAEVEAGPSAGEEPAVVAQLGGESPAPVSGEVVESTSAPRRWTGRLPEAGAVRYRLGSFRRAIDAHWRERRLMIGAGAGLLLVAVIVVALLTSGGGSHARAASHLPPAGCSGCVASISAPKSGGIYTVGQSVQTTFSCVNAARGRPVLSCDDSAGSHTKNGGRGRLDTSTPGVHTYTVTLTLRGGATKAATVSYRVVRPLASSIASSSVRVSHHRARITVACLGGRPSARCHGTITLKLRRLVLGHVRWTRVAHAPYSASRGASSEVVLALSHVAMKALRHATGHHRRVQMIATLAGASPAKKMIRLRLA